MLNKDYRYKELRGNMFLLCYITIGKLKASMSLSIARIRRKTLKIPQQLFSGNAIQFKIENYL